MARWIAIAVALVLATTSCGLTGQEKAELIAAENVDYELLGTTTSTTSTTIVDEPSFQVSLFWHTAGTNALRRVDRGRDSEPTPGQTLLELAAGPTTAEVESNPDLQSRLDPSMEPELFGPDDQGLYRVRIQQSVDEALTPDQAAEIVCTITQFEAISAVLIVGADDTPFSLSGVGAVPIAGPARPSDFADCVETAPPTEDGEGTTTTSG